jgi:hypothetical protein
MPGYFTSNSKAATESSNFKRDSFNAFCPTPGGQKSCRVEIKLSKNLDKNPQLSCESSFQERHFEEDIQKLKIRNNLCS